MKLTVIPGNEGCSFDSRVPTERNPKRRARGNVVTEGESAQKTRQCPFSFNYDWERFAKTIPIPFPSCFSFSVLLLFYNNKNIFASVVSVFN